MGREEAQLSENYERNALRLRQSCVISIILLRVKHNVSRAELARYLGISDYRLKRFETAAENQPSEFICKLAGYFGVSVNFFSVLARRPNELARFLRSRVETGNYGSIA